MLETIDASRMLLNDGDKSRCEVMAYFIPTQQNGAGYSRFGVHLDKRGEANQQVVTVNYPGELKFSRFDRMIWYGSQWHVYLGGLFTTDYQKDEGGNLNIINEAENYMLIKVRRPKSDHGYIVNFDSGDVSLESWQSNPNGSGDVILWQGNIPFVNSPFFGLTTIKLENEKLSRLVISGQNANWNVPLKNTLVYKPDGEFEYDGKNVKEAMEHGLLALERMAARITAEGQNLKIND